MNETDMNKTQQTHFHKSTNELPKPSNLVRKLVMIKNELVS